MIKQEGITVSTNIGTIYRRPLVYTNCDKHLPHDDKYVGVHLLNSKTLYFVVQAKSKVNDLFTQVIHYLGINENIELFGLCIVNIGKGDNVSDNLSSKTIFECNQFKTCSEDCIFLDPKLKLNKYASKQWKNLKEGVDIYRQPSLTVLFRVQFFVDSYLFLSDKLARHQYYLQLRSNVVNFGLTSLTEERAFLLASLAIQADFGNYDPVTHISDYFKPDEYFPLWMINEVGRDYIVRNIPTIHRDQRGLTKNEAQLMYIKEASDANYSPHNMLMYRLSKSPTTVIKKKINVDHVWIGIKPFGIEIYDETTFDNFSQVQTPISTLLRKRNKSKPFISIEDNCIFRSFNSSFCWSDIDKLHFDKKRFEMRSIGNNLNNTIRKFIFYSDTETVAKNLLQICRYTHTFQLLISPRIREMKKRESKIMENYREVYIHGNDEDIIYDKNNNSNNNDNTIDVDDNTIHKNHLIKHINDGKTSKLELLSENIHNTMDSWKKMKETKKFTNECSNMIDSGLNWSSLNDQRISVISNASSNTTSGIVSDRVHSINGDSEADDLGDYNDNLSSSSVDNLSSVNCLHSVDEIDNVPSFSNDLKPIKVNEYFENNERIDLKKLKDVNVQNASQIRIKCGKSNEYTEDSICSTSSEQSAVTIKSTPITVINNEIGSLIQSTTSLESSNNKFIESNIVNVKSKAKPPIRSESLHHTYENIPYLMSYKYPSLTNNHYYHKQNQDNYHPYNNHVNFQNEPYNLVNHTPFSSRNTTKIGISSLTRNCGPKMCEDYLRCRCQNVNSPPVCASEPDLHNSKLWSQQILQIHNDNFQSLPGTNNNSSELLNHLRLSPTLLPPPSIPHIINPGETSLNYVININSPPPPPPPPYKPIRTNSDPTVLPIISKHLSGKSTIAAQELSSKIVESNQIETNPVISKYILTNYQKNETPICHRSMNNLAFTGHPLRLVESEINVNIGLIPPPYEYCNKNQRMVQDKRQMKPKMFGQMLDGRPKATSEQHLNVPISDLNQLKEKSQNMDLPLINALINDKSLMLPKTVAACKRRPRPQSCAISNIQQKQLQSQIQPRQSCSYLDVSNQSNFLNNLALSGTNGAISDIDLSTIKMFTNNRLYNQQITKYQLYA